MIKGKRGKREEKRELPQAKGAWPIVGHLHLLGGSQLPHMVLGDLSDKYGFIFTIKLGVHQVLVVSNSEMAKECFTTNDKIFATRPKTEAMKLLAYNYALFAFAPYGDYWRQVRKITMLEVLSQRRVEMLGHIRFSELRASIKDIFDAWVEKKESEHSDKVIQVEMNQWFGNLMLNIMVKIISGKDVGGCIKAMKNIAKDFDNIFDIWLKEHKLERECVEQRKGCQVFMHALISILEGDSKGDFPGFEHDTIIKATCQQLLIAGLDTTSLTLTWALSLLLNNPEALQIVQDEIDEHVGRDRLVEESDLKNLVYLDAVIKETLRLYPAGPLSLQRDPNIWPDPYEFRPERFLTSHKDIDVKENHFELLPFGSGRRICPGALLALQSVGLTLASLIQQFVLQKPSNEPIDMSESPGLTNNKATPLVVLLSPRLSSSMYCAGA
ncbi:hypothetical protein OSB04_003935 [Centaurea solstitialis]|uniref:Cytochrome P450 n=1 Tax=Centaurea solstitialis TaxID=347529 RepID=A0AA38TXM0_9ASTR|nr:hypothetical protein OSB04_003935 [Centaurea solstitialis]